MASVKKPCVEKPRGNQEAVHYQLPKESRTNKLSA